MKIYCGPFPSLERRFCGRPRAGRVLVVAPSGRLLERLEKALLAQCGCVSGTEFRTFLSLASSLAAASSGGRRFLSDPAYYDYLLKTVLEEMGESERMPSARGFITAIRAAVRDATDACLDPALLLEHLQGDEFRKKSETARVEWLLRLQEAYLGALEKQPFLPPYALLKLASENAASSRYLRGFDSVVFYGFYDLTGLQHELLRAVSKACVDAELYFPLAKHPAYVFANRFFESNVAGLGSGIEWLEPGWEKCAVGRAAEALFNPGCKAASTPVPEKKFAVATVSGSSDELWFAAKEILRLVEREGYAWEDICVTARTFEPYLSRLRLIFAEQRVPVADRVPLPLPAHPLARWAFALLSAEESGFSAQRLRELLASPYLSAGGDWLRVCSDLGAVSGAEKVSAALRAPAEDGKPSAAAAACADWVLALSAAVAPLSGKGAWSGLCDKALSVLEAYLSEEAVGPDGAAALEAFKDCVERLRVLDAVRPAEEGEFLEELCARYEGSELKAGPRAARGVRLLDAMAARGHSFRALIMIGLNEKIFPRVVREDPILRDEHRRFLRDAGGFWITPKMEGYEEERLLFHMLATSARERLVCVCRRSDEDGKAAVPSLYLEELCSAAGFSLRDSGRVRSVPRRFLDKASECEPEALSEGEISALLSLSGFEAGYQAAGLEGECFKASREKASKIGSSSKITAYDGFAGPLPGFYESIEKKGFSPSALETLFSCPMRYFLKYAISLEDRGSALDACGLPRDIRGRLYHAALHGLYESMAGKRAAPLSAEEAGRFLGRYFNAGLHGVYGLYPLVWKTAAEEMKKNILRFYEGDRAAGGGFRPAFFEREAQAASQCGFKVHGRMDRLDVNDAEGAARVVDYKTTLKNRPASLDRLLAAGKIFQPFLYMEMASSLLASEKLKVREAVFVGLDDEAGLDGALPVQAFTAADFQVSEPAVRRLAALLDSLARGGEFFLRPEFGEGGRCSRCAYGGICRNRHASSVARSEGNKRAVELESASKGGDDAAGGR